MGLLDQGRSVVDRAWPPGGASAPGRGLSMGEPEVSLPGPGGSRVLSAARWGLRPFVVLVALTGPGAVPVPADSAADGAVAIPFAHRVGDEWVLH